jgi:hypothetical protein
MHAEYSAEFGGYLSLACKLDLGQKLVRLNPFLCGPDMMLEHDINPLLSTQNSN